MNTLQDTNYEADNTLFIFTTGAQLNLNFDGDSRTGKWKVRTDKIPDNIIIYHKTKKNDIDSTIYKGTIIKYEPTSIQNRYDIIFNNTETIGHTNSNWFEFMQTKSSNPISYK